ncbi:BsuPI-related putative proteinase inhibitor [Litchfieldia alkalitelluris]|uniref:BsuPI-related putative proteinase inhibitor n=1 Tax=Litchfieldia alkalitelluris TaxID=304268 RepID=UPI00099702DA|nr:BsuPI-related putative proteinase inhibitor [Litchfieldia alkalitelluris]
MLRYLLLSIVSLLIISGCGTSGNTNASQGEDAENPETPVNGTPIVEKPDDRNEDTVSGDVQELLELVEVELETSATAGDAAFTITLKNTSDQDVTLTFTSGQKYEIYVKNKAGLEVYRYSIDKSFIMALQDVEIKAGEEVSWTEVWNYNQTGERIASGEYTATVEIVATQVNGVDVAVAETLRADAKVTVPEENTAFRNIHVMGSDGEYTVTGEARVFEASFFYSVEDGHDYLVKETVFQADEGAPSWSPFEINISIPSDKLPSNGTATLVLYERSAKDGEIVNRYHTVLEQFSGK